MANQTVRVPFDPHTLAKHLNGNEPLAMVIRAHLYVEYALIRSIEAALYDKAAFDDVLLPFPLKVQLAVALGKLDASNLGSLKALNKLRVQFAHNINAELKEQNELDLYNSLSPMVRETVDGLRKAEMSLMARLRCDMIGLILAAAGLGAAR